MAIDNFTDNPQKMRKVVNREGDNVERSSGPNAIDGGIKYPSYEVSVKDKPGLGSDQTITHVGPGSGTSTGVGKATDVQGFVSATGNKVVIDNSFGSDTIVLQHHTGATIMIDADGSVHMVSAGKKGIGMISPKGDGTVYAKNHLILKADGKLTIETDGDLDLNVGGNFSLHVEGDMSTYVEGSVEESIDGHKVTEIVKDHQTTIAGDNRLTVAGNMWTQVTNGKTIDVGKDFTMRSDGNALITSIKAMSIQAKENLAIDSKKTMAIRATEDIGFSTKESFFVASEGPIGLSSKATITTKSQGTSSFESMGSLKVISGATTKLSAGAGYVMHAAGNIDIRGNRTDVQAGGPSPDIPTAPGDPNDALEAPKAQYATAEIIIDNISTVREAPDFPRNAKRMSAERMSLYENEGQTPNPKAYSAAAGNRGAGINANIQSAGVTLPSMNTNAYDRPAGSVTGTGRAEKNPLPIPRSVLNSNEKISRHVTIGMLIGIRQCPGSQQQAVLTEAANLAWNIVDPLIDKFGNRIYITSWWRNNSSNHITGGAVDMRAANKQDVQLTAEIAAFVRDNLPFSKILLEKNNSPGIHVHIESAEPGQQGGGSVLTCADPKCNSSVPGLQLSYAVAALKGRSV